MANVFSKALNRILCADVRGKHSLPRCEAAGEEPALGEGSRSAQAPGACEGSADISRAPRRGGAGVVVPFKGALKPPARKVALFIDAENVGCRFARGALEVARAEGEIVVAKAYGPANVIGSNGWKAVMQREGLDSHICTGCRKGKNSVDMNIAVDAVITFFLLGIDVLVIVSSDCDFASLASRVRQHGGRFHGIGQNLPASTYPHLCDAWTNLAELEGASGSLEQGMRGRIGRAARECGVDEAVLVDLVECMQVLGTKGQWVDVSRLSNDIHLLRPGFTPKACGCPTFKKLLEKTNLFEFSSTGTVWKVRLKAA